MRIAVLMPLVLIACGHAARPETSLAPSALVSVLAQRLELNQTDPSRAFQVRGVGTWSIRAETLLVHLDTLHVVRRPDGRTGAQVFAVSLFLVTAPLPNADAHSYSMGYGGELVRRTLPTPDGQDAVLLDVDLATVAGGRLIDWPSYGIRLRLFERWDRQAGQAAPEESDFDVDGPRGIFRDVPTRR